MVSAGDDDDAATGLPGWLSPFDGPSGTLDDNPYRILVRGSDVFMVGYSADPATQFDWLTLRSHPATGSF